MISNTDFEKLWFLYQTEGAGKGVSINTYCQQNGIPYNEFEKWFKKTHRAVERLEVTGMPESKEPDASETETPKTETANTSQQTQQQKHGILLTIKTRDGLFIQKGGLDYKGVKLLVERLEGLC